jgi:hypothetical protein
MRRETLLPFGRAYDVARRPMLDERQRHERAHWMSEIEVRTVDAERLVSRFHVRVTDDDGSATEHDVTLSALDHERLGAGYPDPDAFVHACFGFLLAREPKGSILRSFDVRQIATYFPEFEAEITR